VQLTKPDWFEPSCDIGRREETSRGRSHDSNGARGSARVAPLTKKDNITFDATRGQVGRSIPVIKELTAIEGIVRTRSDPSAIADRLMK